MKKMDVCVCEPGPLPLTRYRITTNTMSKVNLKGNTRKQPPNLGVGKDFLYKTQKMIPEKHQVII